MDNFEDEIIGKEIRPAPICRTGATSVTSGQAGNYQPGFPVHPSEANTIRSNLVNSNFRHVADVKSEGHSGQIPRTDYNPGLFSFCLCQSITQWAQIQKM